MRCFAENLSDFLRNRKGEFSYIELVLSEPRGQPRRKIKSARVRPTLYQNCDKKVVIEFFFCQDFNFTSSFDFQNVILCTELIG